MVISDFQGGDYEIIKTYFVLLFTANHEFY